MHATARHKSRAFTLIELLVVIAIIGLISAVALPVVLPALNERKISEAARLVQAVLSGARDNAVRAGEPRGIRFLIDPVFTGKIIDSGSTQLPLASNRMIAIEPGPDYSEGLVRHSVSPTYDPPIYNGSIPDPAYDLNPSQPAMPRIAASLYYLRISSSPLSPGRIPNSPTGWTSNIRQGDRIRFQGSGNIYTVAGPIAPMTLLAKGINYPEQFNRERFIYNVPSANPVATQATLPAWTPEFLHLTNGIDDNGNGWIDESCDGIDNDGDGIIDPGFNGIDDNGNGYVDEYDELISSEYEKEVFVGSQQNQPPTNDSYTIYRTPVVSSGAREVSLPDGIVLDLTTWNAALSTPNNVSKTMLPERSRLPVDPYSKFVDVMLSPNGQVVNLGVGGGSNFARSPVSNSPFYHFWLTEREGVNPPLWDGVTKTLIPRPNPNLSSTTNPQSYLLPMPKGTQGTFAPYEPMTNNPNNAAQTYNSNPVFLTGNRRLVTLFTKTGQVITNSIETFDANDTNAPYYTAQTGIKEPQ